MQGRKDRNCGDVLTRAGQGVHWVSTGACLAVAAALAVTAQTSSLSPGGTLRIDKASESTPINQPPDANTLMLMHEQQTRQQDYASANLERKKQIADDSAKLLKLAAELKAAVDKTDKDTLSLNVIRKADEIEKLAHYVKEKMKLTMGHD